MGRARGRSNGYLAVLLESHAKDVLGNFSGRPSHVQQHVCAKIKVIAKGGLENERIYIQILG
jgi:hypothetical protein